MANTARRIAKNVACRILSASISFGSAQPMPKQSARRRITTLKPRTRLGAQDFRIGDAGNRPAGTQDHRGGDHGPRQGASPSLVDAGDA